MDAAQTHHNAIMNLSITLEREGERKASQLRHEAKDVAYAAKQVSSMLIGALAGVPIDPIHWTAYAGRLEKNGIMVPRLEDVQVNPPRPTLFECRCCSNAVGGKSDGSFDEPGWNRIAHIDGPNAICPSCWGDPHALDALIADGYDDACKLSVADGEEHAVCLDCDALSSYHHQGRAHCDCGGEWVGGLCETMFPSS